MHLFSKLLRTWRLGWRTPVSFKFGFDRGQPIDRYYIEGFLDRNRHDISGRVLEIGDSEYTKRFGSFHVIHSDVLHVEEGNQQATLVGNLATGEGIPNNTFDCMILTQTFPFIYDMNEAIKNS